MNYNDLFNQLPPKEIFNYFNDSTLHELSSVNHQFRQLSRYHLSTNYAQVRTIINTYTLLKNQQTEKDAELKACSEEVKNKKQEQQTIKNTWLGYFVSKFNSYNQLIIKISEVLSRIFPFFKKEMINQKNLEIILKKEKENEEKLIEQKNELDKQAQKAFDPIFKRDLFLKTYSTQKLEMAHHRNASNVFESIIQAFGGQEKFKQLPVLNISSYEKQIEEQNKKWGYKIEIQNISMPNKVKDLITQPIMRGTFQNGSDFFVIRAKNLKHEFCYQVFYMDISSQAHRWEYFCDTIINVSSCLEQKILMPTFGPVLEKFIQEGKNDDYTLA